MAGRPLVVLDSNVLEAAMRSRRGASFAVLSAVGTGRFDVAVSVPVVLEYEEVLKRPGMLPHLTPEEIDVFLDYFLSRCVEQKVFFHWRPLIPDADDDMLVELAVAAGASYIISSNVGDLKPAVTLGLQVVTPRDFLHSRSQP